MMNGLKNELIIRPIVLRPFYKSCTSFLLSTTQLPDIVLVTQLFWSQLLISTEQSFRYKNSLTFARKQKQFGFYFFTVIRGVPYWRTSIDKTRDDLRLMTDFLLPLFRRESLYTFLASKSCRGWNGRTFSDKLQNGKWKKNRWTSRRRRQTSRRPVEEDSHAVFIRVYVELTMMMRNQVFLLLNFCWKHFFNINFFIFCSFLCWFLICNWKKWNVNLKNFFMFCHKLILKHTWKKFKYVWWNYLQNSL